MEKPTVFSFGDQSIAAGYDTILVPLLFDSWATQLVDDFKPWQGQCILDLATGTGILAQRLAEEVGPNGRVIAADISDEMLTLAKQRCAGASQPVEFIISPAQALALPNTSVDVVVCQQGFQFFPDKPTAAKEIFRVLCKQGRVIISTWRPVEECDFFSIACAALDAIGETALSEMLRVPFSSMPASELTLLFEEAGFENVQVKQQQRALTISGGVPHAIKIIYSTPIAPMLRALPDERQSNFQEKFTELLNSLSSDGQTMGRMTSNVLSAEKLG